MLTSSELKKIPIFSCLNDANLMWLSQQAADLHLEPGEYLIHEGEPTPFFVVMDGTTEVLKDVMGRQTEVSEHKPGDFFGELAILMATAAPASVRAKTACHLARLDPQYLQELIRRSPEFSAVILQTLNERVQVVQKYMLNLPSSRVQIVGSKFDDDCREIRTFLSMNRIPYEWVDRDRSAHPAPTDQACEVAGLSVVVDGSFCVSHPPTVRKVAEALGFQTAPHRQSYDVVIIGGGPAGLAAAVYGASEGLSVLLVERKAPGGQAGTSSRIENYLGFPNGISGDDLSQRAFRQAVKFGAEVVLTREVQEIIPHPDGAYTIGLDGSDRVATKTVILATGVAWRRLEADGVDRFIGRGVLYGAARTEAPTVAGKRVFIIGGGNSAGQAALFFADLREFSDHAGPRRRSEAQHVAILDRSDCSRAGHSGGDGNSGGLCRRHGLLESNRNPENGGACHPAGCRCTVCHDRRRCSNPLVATSTPTRKRLCPHGARGERPARLGSRSCSISAGNKSSGLLLCR